jgi:hypothetical protein
MLLCAARQDLTLQLKFSDALLDAHREIFNQHFQLQPLQQVEVS